MGSASHARKSEIPLLFNSFFRILTRRGGKEAVKITGESQKDEVITKGEELREEGGKEVGGSGKYGVVGKGVEEVNEKDGFDEEGIEVGADENWGREEDEVVVGGVNTKGIAPGGSGVEGSNVPENTNDVVLAFDIAVRC